MPLIKDIDVRKLNGLAPRACELCRRRKDGTFRCSACQAVYYCGRDCQTQDRNTHKTQCKSIKKARRVLEREEKKLHDRDDPWIPEDVFNTCVGRFWGILETRPYMRARYGVVDALLLSYGTAGGSADVVQTALDHLRDMMRLCRGDNMGLRQVIVGLYIRLGRDQDAYDLMKWYATTGQDKSYDWGDVDLPYLDVRDADVLEEPLRAWTNYAFQGLSHAAAVTLVKIRVLLDLQAIQSARMALRGAIPGEIIEMIRAQLVGGVVGSRREILLAGEEETARLIGTVKRQIKELYDATEAYNSHFWKLLVDDPDAGTLRRPSGP